MTKHDSRGPQVRIEKTPSLSLRLRSARMMENSDFVASAFAACNKAVRLLFHQRSPSVPFPFAVQIVAI